jgi:hypothetical protein
MSRLRILLAVVLAASALAVLGGAAHASVPAANAKFCKAVASIGDSGNSSNPTKEDAKKALRGFKRAAKYAPGKVKSALNNITKYLSVVTSGDTSDIADLASSSTFKNYTKSLSTYVSYYTSNCLGSG